MPPFIHIMFIKFPWPEKVTILGKDSVEKSSFVYKSLRDTRDVTNNQTTTALVYLTSFIKRKLKKYLKKVEISTSLVMLTLYRHFQQLLERDSYGRIIIGTFGHVLIVFMYFCSLIVLQQTTTFFTFKWSFKLTKTCVNGIQKGLIFHIYCNFFSEVISNGAEPEEEGLLCSKLQLCM